ncbi:MAG: 4Fe-4S binding protein [Pirellulales bacterium]|nr:4Fe-4S binding protein [Pirellulales bacterium]
MFRLPDARQVPQLAGALTDMQTARRTTQASMLALTVLAVFVFRSNAERWCPFGGVEAIYTYVSEGNMICSLGTSNFFILGGVLLTAVLLRRAFCGYLCPIGTISEMLRSAGARLRTPTIRVPRRLDRVLGAMKYVVLGTVLYFTWRAGELLFRGYDPCYALISRHGADITHWAYVISAAIALASLAIRLPFCRWFCPFAAVLHPFSRFALTRIRRDPSICTHCQRCAKACPMDIPVDRLEQVTSASCLSCMQCLDACAHKPSGAIHWGPPVLLGGRWPQAALVVLLVACTAGAVSAAYLFPMPSFVKSRGSAPPETASIELEVENLTCRGRANLFFWYLERDDLFRIPGYLKVEGWPGPEAAEVRITYDPTLADAAAVKHAVTEPYYNLHEDLWRPSPFRIDGYDPIRIDPMPVGP